MVPRLAAVLLLAAVATPGFAAPEPEKIAAAIKQGQYYLKAVYDPRGGGNRPGAAPRPPSEPDLLPFIGGQGFGSATLAGLALLESGVPADDPVIVHIERGLRQSAFFTKATYELALLIMFFDRLGKTADTPMIQFLTLRLMSGQSREGTWGYSCNGLALDNVSERQLQDILTRDARIATGPPAKKEARPGSKDPKPRSDLDVPPAKKEEPKPEPKKESKGLHPALEKLLPQIGRGGATNGPGGIVFYFTSDHSNTQFATVGLWIGRRHHVDVSAALTAIDKHYREVQWKEDGGWAYTSDGGVSSPSMTCAGLMGLAMGHGVRMLNDSAKGKPVDPEAIDKDKAVADALKYVGNALAAVSGVEGGFAGQDLNRDLYFMWSLERVGMVYGLKTIGKVDWYDWGSTSLVKIQNRDGSWPTGGGTGHGTAENTTAFALLFLSRANLAQDLAATLKGKVRDPGTSRLVTGADLADIMDKARMASGNKKPEAKAPPKVGPATVKTPPTPVDPKLEVVQKLADALVKATPTERAALLATYRDTKGSDYTDALVLALTKMTGADLAETRDALAMRLTRMSVANLVDYMGDKNRELRRAAALACAAKGRDRMKEFAETLIALVGDPDPLVVQAARASLKELSGQDHGPEPTATAADRDRALIAWRQWWAGQK